MLKLFEVHTVAPTLFHFFFFFFKQIITFIASLVLITQVFQIKTTVSPQGGSIGLKVFLFDLACKVSSDIILHMTLKKFGVTPLYFPNTFLLSGFCMVSHRSFVIESGKTSGGLLLYDSRPIYPT